MMYGGRKEDYVVYTLAVVEVVVFDSRPQIGEMMLILNGKLLVHLQLLPLNLASKLLQK